MKVLITVIDDVTDEKTVKSSVETLVHGVAEKVKDAGTDSQKLKDLSAELKTSAPALAAAVVANTPAASPAGTATSGTASAWKPQTAYTLGNYVQPSPSNGHTYVCSAAGTSGSTQPAFPTAVGASIADGSVTWSEKTAAVAKP